MEEIIMKLKTECGTAELDNKKEKKNGYQETQQKESRN